MTFLKGRGFLKGFILPMAAILLLLSFFQNCSVADFSGKESGPVYNANGDGHEGKLSIPIDYVKVQSGNGYQNDIVFDLTQALSTNTTLNRVGYYCRSEAANFREGLDVLVSSPANSWAPADEVYSFASGLPAGVSFIRNSSAMSWNAAGLLQSSVDNQPRFVTDSNGEFSLLLELGSVNLLTRSEEIGVGDWSTNLVLTAFHPSIPSPTGALNARVIRESNASGASRFVRQDFTSPAGVYTFSVYVKELSPGRVVNARLQLSPGDAQLCRFDFATQNLTLFQGEPGTSCNVTAHANGWFRLSITGEISTATAFGGVGLSHPTLGDNYPFAGHPGVLVWGAQMEQGSQPSSYIPSGLTPGVRDSDQLVVRSGSPLLSGANLELQYSLPSENSQLDVNFGNSLLQLSPNNVNFNGPLIGASFANNQALGSQKLNGQVATSGFVAYGDGRLVGESNQAGLFVGTVQVSASRGEALLRQLTVEPQILRQEMMAVSSIIDFDPSLSYAVLVLGRESERVQTQPIPLEDLGSDSFTGQMHHFDLLQSTSGPYGFEGSLDDGTLLTDALTCHKQ